MVTIYSKYKTNSLCLNSGTILWKIAFWWKCLSLLHLHANKKY